MNGLDVFLFIIIAYGFIRGLFKGLVLELSSLIGIILGIVAGRLYAHPFAEMIKGWFDITIEHAQPIAFVLIFILVSILLHLIALAIDKSLNLIALGWANKILGSLFGGLKYIILLSVLLNLFYYLNAKRVFISEATTEKSILYNPIKKIIPTIAPQFFPEEETKVQQK
jgi:membrane protein required for colicin V production